jgi:predicted MFS family arabinose efflux permease
MQHSIKTGFSHYQKLVIGALAFLQFAVVLDFLIIAPIGDVLMKSLGISTQQFGLVVSSYAFSAGISGILMAGFADRYDRKKLLLVFLFGFMVGTLLCGLSSTYTQLLLSRIVTGIFAGVTSSAILTIIADLFPANALGRAMSGVQMAFAASQIFGVPLGLLITNTLGWNSAFMAIVVLALVIFAVIAFTFKPINAHLGQQTEANPLVHLWHTVRNKQYQIGFLAITFLSVGGYMLLPFSAVFLINNVHITHTQLPLVFLFTGLSSLIVMPIVGKLSDTYDRYRIFLFGSVAAIVMVTIYTHLSVTPLWLMITVNMTVFAAILCRMSPAMALNTMVPQPQDRGAYMSVSASLQQMAGGIGSALAGMIVSQPSSHSPLQNFDVLGYLLVSVFVACIYLVYKMNKSIQKNSAMQLLKTNSSERFSG